MDKIKIIEQPDLESVMKIDIGAPAAAIYYYLERMGGDNGYYSYDSFFRLQGAIGKGKPRLRSLDGNLYPGGKIDFFVIEKFETDKMLLLSFKAPGITGESSFYLQENENSITHLSNEVRMNFLSSIGKIYWKIVQPFDFILRKKMLKNIKKFAESEE